ncbi:hypothetical protein BX600DRAFT_433454 [Xylariales sp. PMI_506]|nr:hypothetical protein BX600DRAFT_433454 [Xylariales sp. PMI_506]
MNGWCQWRSDKAKATLPENCRAEKIEGSGLPALASAVAAGPSARKSSLKLPTKAQTAETVPTLYTGPPSLPEHCLRVPPTTGPRFYPCERTLHRRALQAALVERPAYCGPPGIQMYCTSQPSRRNCFGVATSFLPTHWGMFILCGIVSWMANKLTN